MNLFYAENGRAGGPGSFPALVVTKEWIDKELFLPLKKFCSFYNGHGSVLDPQQFIHSWNLQLRTL